MGQPEMVKMLAVMNIKGGLHHKTFNTINQQVLGKLLHGPAADNLKTAHSIVHRQYETMHGETSGPRDISVSFDGTWHIKEHSSTIGACFVIEQISGLVMDYIVLSKYCVECQLVGEKLEGEEKALWMEAHRDVCDRNHTGSSGSMETEGTKILWKRSVDVGGFRYTSLVGDGDAAVIESVNAIDPYHGVTVVKEECINHVAKRMFKGLERVVRDGNAEVKLNKAVCAAATTQKDDVSTSHAKKLLTKSMGDKGRMTKEKMKKWSSYYRKAIVENAPDVEAARNAVWAIFFHSLSTLEDPHHSFCSESWCFWKQAEKEGVDPKRKYAETRHDVPLPRDVSERLIPLFQRLSNHELLCRCMKLQTSNANESLHATVWRRAPKSKYCGKKTAEMAVALAVMQYNKGATALVDAVDSLGVSPGSEVVRVASRINVVRVRKADHATRQASKTSRERKALEKLQLGVHQEATEGNLYESGAH